MECVVCHQEEDILYACAQCPPDRGYCTEHRTDHQHVRPVNPPETYPQRGQTISNYVVWEHIPGAWTSGTEWQDLIVASLVITLALGFWDLLRGDWQYVLLIGLIVSLSFVFHEMAHKYTAIQFGHDSRFIIFTRYVAMSLFFALLGLAFILVGAAVSLGVRGIKQDELGKMGAAGPASNLLLGALSYLSWLVLQPMGLLDSTVLGQSLGHILLLSVWINGFLGAFNLIPIGMLDGKKVFSWNLIVWLVLVAGNVGLYFLGDSHF